MREGPGARQEERMWSPGPSFQPTQDWEQQIRRDLNQLCLSRTNSTRFEREQELMKLQEETRKGIQNQLEQIKQLNQTINSERPQSQETEDSVDLDDFQNVLAARDPALLSPNYETRLQLMKKCESRLQVALERKSRRLRGLEAQKYTLSHMSKYERSNLQ